MAITLLMRWCVPFALPLFAAITRTEVAGFTCDRPEMREQRRFSFPVSRFQGENVYRPNIAFALAKLVVRDEQRFLEGVKDDMKNGGH